MAKLNLSGAPVTIVTSRLPSACVEKSVNTVNSLSLILRVYVPAGEVWVLDPMRAFLMYLAFAETIAATGGAGDETFAATKGVARVLDVNGDHEDGQYQAVTTDADGSTFLATKAVNDSGDSGADTIVATVAGNADHRVIYTPSEAGALQVRVVSPRETGQLSHIVWEGDTQQLHTMNQYRHNRFRSMKELYIPEHYMLEWWLNAAWACAWTTGATTNGTTEIPFARVQFPVWRYPIHQFYLDSEKGAQKGASLRASADDWLSRHG